MSKRARGPAPGVELCPGSWGPAAFLANLCERVRVPRIKVVGSLLGGVGQEADGVKSHGQLLGGVTSAAADLAVADDREGGSVWVPHR
jgi:hypothetical protein